MIDIEPFKLAVDDTEVIRATKNVGNFASALDKAEDKIDSFDKSASKAKGISEFNDTIAQTAVVVKKLDFI